MNEQLINAASEAVLEIASTMLFLEITPGDKREGQCTTIVAYSAIVGLSGGIKGSVRLAAPEDGALKLASALMGEELTEMNGDASDGFAELCNMTAGGIQSRMAGVVGAINLTPPVVVSGNPHHVSGNTKEKVVSQSFTTDGVTFFVEVHYIL